MQVATATVLTAYTGILLCPLNSLYKFLSDMTGENVFTHQIPRVLTELKPVLQEQLPQLADFPFTEGENVLKYLENAECKLGSTLEVATPTPGCITSIDPLSELAEKVHPSKIIVASSKG